MPSQLPSAKTPHDPRPITVAAMTRRILAALLLGVFCMGATGSALARECLSLAGEWKLRIDPDGVGAEKQWFSETLTNPVKLPGSLADNGVGQKDVSMGTSKWSFVYTYPADGDWNKKGAAWYQKEVVIPESWRGKRVTLFLERSRWTQVWVDGQCAGSAQAWLSTPHIEDVSALLTPGHHRITIQVQTACIYPRVRDSHQFAMQGRWNGIIGRLELQAVDPVWIESVQIYPDVTKRTAKVRAVLGNATGRPQRGKLQLEAALLGRDQPAARGAIPFAIDQPTSVVETDLAMGNDVRLWSEFTPDLYCLKAKLSAEIYKDEAHATFGMREFKTRGLHFTLNGQPIFLRGNTDNAAFPKTAYPPMGLDEWKQYFKIAKVWGLNHIRFHSWCPPEAAFQAADEAGFYLQVEGPLNGTSDNAEEISYIGEETQRILDSYGNHPSFSMLSSGNEGHMKKEVCKTWIDEWQRQDARHLYTHSTSGGGLQPFSDFWVACAFARINWGREGEHPGCLRGAFHDPLVGHVNNSSPSTLVDYSESLEGKGVPNIPKIDRPVVSHEVGQYDVYPNYREMAKYTGAVRLKNYELFRKSLEAHHLLDQADDFVRASGELQVLLYREEIEAALRTPGLAGFQLLALEDQQEQGTAICGMLDAFREPKPYGNPAEFRQWCGPVVPLLRMKQYSWTTAETFAADVQVAHYGPSAFNAAVIKWSLQNREGKTLISGTLPPQRIEAGGLANLGHIEASLSSLPAPAAYTITLAIENTAIQNHWKIWLYPETLPPVDTSEILITEKWDASVEQALSAGRKVLYLPKPSALPHSVAGSFATDFWCFPMFKGFNPPGTLGLWCTPKHPALAAFPTEFHADWQWWDLVKHSRAMILDDLPAGLRPLVQIIDNLERNQKLGVLFEAKVGAGRLLVCSIDLVSGLERRPVARQFRYSLLRYMASGDFSPAVSLAPGEIANLGRSTSQSKGLELAEPVGIHRAAMVVHCASKLQGDKAAWKQQFDDVAVKIPGFDYALSGNVQCLRNFGITFWNAPEMKLMVTCPKGWTGNLHLRFQDINRQKRSATLTLNGNQLGDLCEHTDGAWVVVPLKERDTADGSVQIRITAPEKKDVILTDWVLMPTGTNDPG